MSEVLNHLWQSTLFAALVAVTALALKSNRAGARYWLWLSASFKFLVPFTLLMSIGTRVDVLPPTTTMPALAVEQMTTSLAPAPPLAAAFEVSRSWWAWALVIVWLAGAAFLLLRWLLRWRRVRTAVREARRLPIQADIPVLSSQTSIEPGVFGIFRPVLLLPEGITANLSAAELDAILAHELSHVRRRDNLTSALHMWVEAMFWFHPLVWWIGRKLVDERERACDEAVLEEGNEPHVYAQSILNVCKHYVESPLACASGVSGADLRKRIIEIMARPTSDRLSLTRKMALSAALTVVVAVPVAIGILRAQVLPPPPQYKFEVASIRPGDPSSQHQRIGPGPQGGLRTENTNTLNLIMFAYDVREFQIEGGPGWIRTDRLNVTGTPDTPEEAPNPAMDREKLQSMFNRQRQRMQALLAERFGLVLRAEKREMPVYSLTAIKSVQKLTPLEGQATGRMNVQMRPGMLTAAAATMPMLASSLSGFLGRPVIDETGLTGTYDIKLEWTPDSRPVRPGDAPPAATTSDAEGPSIFTAVQEQLGLKLESKKGLAPVFVIEKIEKPSEN